VGDVVGELERAYLFFNDRFFGGGLPAAIALSVEHGRSKCLGSFCARLWHHGPRDLEHIAIHVASLGQGAGPALEVLLHEMVHCRNGLAGIPDCHPENHYHNRHFRDAAVLAGLDCSQRDSRLGYTQTRLNEEGQRAVAELRPDVTVFQWSVGARPSRKA
jgi:hypothetical protein